MSGIKPLRKVQLGSQTSSAAVACTAIWHGNGLLEDTRVQKMIDADVGIMSGVDDMYETALGAAMLFETTPASFEQLPHLAEMTIMQVTTATQDGSGSGYIRQYTFPTTTVPTLRAYTVQTGDNEQAEVADYCFGTDFTLTGDEREGCAVAARGGGPGGAPCCAKRCDSRSTAPPVPVSGAAACSRWPARSRGPGSSCCPPGPSGPSRWIPGCDARPGGGGGGVDLDLALGVSGGSDPGSRDTCPHYRPGSSGGKPGP